MIKAPHWQKGWEAEETAAAFLSAKGYAILARRLKTPFGEIDVLAQQGNTLVVVEVKARKNFTTGVEAISSTQQQRLANAITAFIAENSAFAAADIRFDCVVITPNAPPLHLTDAWQMDEG